MIATDLFGDPAPALEDKPESELERKRRKRREASRPKGYAAQPGSGPQGKRCKDCQHAYPVKRGSGKRFWKCDLVKETHGPGTDILANSPACKRYDGAR